MTLNRRWILLVLAGIFLLLIYALFWPGGGKSVISIDVSAGTTALQVAEELEIKGLLSTRLPFLVWIKLRGAGEKIKIGRYEFSQGRSAFWIVDDLVNGRTKKVRLTIPEGFASWQIAERLGILEICDPLEFQKFVAEKKWEGFLFPATYEFDIGLKAGDVARYLKNQFDQRWTPALARRAQERGWTKKQTVTLASIIEREVMNREELKLVSAVYNNRLKKRMRLEADPTVQYALGFWKSRLTYQDYRKTKSPYNTYLHAGLPPGPICNPGIDAVEAALWPADSKALFLLAKEDGTHTFSQNYREHVNKVNRRNRDRGRKKK